MTPPLSPPPPDPEILGLATAVPDQVLDQAAVAEVGRALFGAALFGAPRQKTVKTPTEFIG